MVLIKLDILDSNEILTTGATCYQQGLACEITFEVLCCLLIKS